MVVFSAAFSWDFILILCFFYKKIVDKYIVKTKAKARWLALSRDHLNIFKPTFALLKALKINLFTLKPQMIKLSEVHKCKSPLENFHIEFQL